MKYAFYAVIGLLLLSVLLYIARSRVKRRKHLHVMASRPEFIKDEGDSLFSLRDAKDPAFGTIITISRSSKKQE